MYCVAFKVLSCTVFILLAIGSAEGPSVIRDDIPAPEYSTSEDFYKLTGVEFPELEMVDSLFFQDGGFPTSYWSEYKFVAKDGLDDRFYPALGEPIIGDKMHYSYRICPDQEPVDRSRGSCDRMKILDDGRMIKDLDGSFITVDIVNDTIILRDVWLH